MKTLGSIIENYRAEHDLTQRQFADLSGLSYGYVSMLEKNRNPQTNKPIVPSVETIRKVAHGTGMSFDDLFALLDKNQIISTTETEEEKISRIVRVALRNPLLAQLIKTAVWLTVNDLQILNDMADRMKKKKGS